MSIVYDTIYFKRGPEATMPNIANNGEPLWTTDTHRLFVGYGNGTKEIVSSPVITPEMFGALGDGITDDTAAIQAACDSGKYIFFGAYKTYAVQGRDDQAGHAIILGNAHSNIKMIGIHSTIKMIGPSKGGIFVAGWAGTSTAGESIDNVEISSLRFEGNADGLATFDNNIVPYGIAFKGSVSATYNSTTITNIHIHDCTFKGFAVGVFADGTKGITVERCRTAENWFYPAMVYGGYGIWMQSCYDVTIQNNHLIGTSSAVSYSAGVGITTRTDRHAIYIACLTTKDVGGRRNQNVKILNNTIDWSGITIFDNTGGDTDTYPNSTTGLPALVARATTELLIEGNTVYGGTHSIYCNFENDDCDNISITRNMVVETNVYEPNKPFYAIAVLQPSYTGTGPYTPTYTTKNVNISGNMINNSTDYASGIIIWGLEDVTVAGNVSKMGGVHSGHITVQSIKNVLIDGNTTSGASCNTLVFNEGARGINDGIIITDTNQFNPSHLVTDINGLSGKVLCQYKGNIKNTANSDYTNAASPTYPPLTPFNTVVIGTPSTASRTVELPLAANIMDGHTIQFTRYKTASASTYTIKLQDADIADDVHINESLSEIVLSAAYESVTLRYYALTGWIALN